MRNWTAKRLQPFGTTIFAEMTALAKQHDAINLAQGFPDFNGPAAMIEAAYESMQSGDNQYSRSAGHPRLVESIARFTQAHFGRTVDPESEVAVTSGATEGIAAAMLGILDPGDEVILFEPFYDSYLAIAELAGAVPRLVTLKAPDFRLDAHDLASVFTNRTKLVVLNTPHNPTGRVFDRTELGVLADLCIQNDVAVISDEVYEHITFTEDGAIPFSSVPGMGERTLTLSSAGKTFSFTGWKIGWSTGPSELVSAQVAAHQFLTFCAATPLQVAVAAALDNLPLDYYFNLKAQYRLRRDLLAEALETSGFQPIIPEGTYFILADFANLSDQTDREFARTLTEKIGVASVPPSVFYRDPPPEAQHFLRFSFSKERSTLEEAAKRLSALRR